MESTQENISYRLEVNRGMWENFKSCLRRIYWKEGITLDKGLIMLIEKFIEQNSNDKKEKIIVQ